MKHLPHKKININTTMYTKLFIFAQLVCDQPDIAAHNCAKISTYMFLPVLNLLSENYIAVAAADPYSFDCPGSISLLCSSSAVCIAASAMKSSFLINSTREGST